MTWTHVTDETALPEGSMAPVHPLGINLGIARVGGMVYAVSGKCAHTWLFESTPSPRFQPSILAVRQASAVHVENDRC
jgi:nitrite reductase/ring-hydroxylating ferredoxin subunit